MKNVCCVNIREIHSNFVNHLNQVNQLNSGSDILCPNKEAALVIIVVACPPWRITPLYHMPVWVFSCVMNYPKLPALHKHLFTGKGIGLFI